MTLNLLIKRNSLHLIVLRSKLKSDDYKKSFIIHFKLFINHKVILMYFGDKKDKKEKI